MPIKIAYYEIADVLWGPKKHDEVFVVGRGWFKVRGDSCIVPTPQDLPLTVRAKIIEYYDKRLHAVRSFIVILPFSPPYCPERYDYSGDMPVRLYEQRPPQAKITDEWLNSLPD